jgi:hypothetical protein
MEVVVLGPTSPDELQVAPAVGLRFDTTSWFPVPDGREQAKGVFLVSMVMFDDDAATAFRGTSTLLVTSSRLLGVCPRGVTGADGPLDHGRVAVWSILLDQVDWVHVHESADGGHIVLKGSDTDTPWALVTKPRVADEGAFQSAPLADLAEVVNRAKHSSA